MILLRILRALWEGTFLEKCRNTGLDRVLPWIWFLTPVPTDHIGFGSGPLALLRRQRHRRLHRKIRIALLEHGPARFGELTCFWINERCRQCSASLNAEVQRADILWVYSQDPLDHNARSSLLQSIAEARAGVRVMNNPDHYNAYHTADAFARLETAGVNVPRWKFSDKDLENTDVVYKLEQRQAAPKSRELYRGPVAGHRSFEFIDSRGSDGLYRRYRAFYVCGAIRPSKLMMCDDWNVCLKNNPHLKYTFEMTDDEIRQMRLIAKTFGLDYFAADYVRRRGDDKPYFLDINVYPAICSPVQTARGRGYYGRWHTFDSRRRLRIPEPGGRPFEDVFDLAMRRFVDGASFPPGSQSYW